MIDNNKITYLEALNQGLKQSMAENKKVVVIGEDVRDPYGGAFKVTQGLFHNHPERVFNTPISEAAIVGLATGLALRGLLPVVEIMFGDFLALCADQLLNSATKFPLMYKHKVEVPLVIRTPMGGGRGYGPTHSQSIEKMFFGMPGLHVIAPSLYHQPGELLRRVITNERSPVLFLEHKLMYPKLLLGEQEGEQVEYHDAPDYPVAVVKNYTEGNPDAVVVGYGIVGQHLHGLMDEFREEEIRLLGILPSAIHRPLPDSVLPLIKGCQTIIVAEESTKGFNWGSEVAADLYERLLGDIKKPIIRLASEPDAIPAAREAEAEVLLTEKKIRQAIFQGLL